MKKKIGVLEDEGEVVGKTVDWSPVDALADVTVHTQRLRGDALFDAVKDADAIAVVRDRTPFKADLMARRRKLKLFIFTGGRNTQLDFAALAARGIPVANTIMGSSKDSTVEITWALILAAAKRLEPYLALVRAGRWRDGNALPQSLSGERLGLIGFGEIGSRVGRVGPAPRMEGVASRPPLTPERAAAGRAESRA